MLTCHNLTRARGSTLKGAHGIPTKSTPGGRGPACVAITETESPLETWRNRIGWEKKIAERGGGGELKLVKGEERGGSQLQKRSPGGWDRGAQPGGRLG